MRRALQVSHLYFMLTCPLTRTKFARLRHEEVAYARSSSAAALRFLRVNFGNAMSY